MGDFSHVRSLVIREVPIAEGLCEAIWACGTKSVIAKVDSKHPLCHPCWTTLRIDWSGFSATGLTRAWAPYSSKEPRAVDLSAGRGWLRRASAVGRMVSRQAFLFCFRAEAIAAQAKWAKVGVRRLCSLSCAGRGSAGNAHAYIIGGLMRTALLGLVLLIGGTASAEGIDAGVIAGFDRMSWDGDAETGLLAGIRGGMAINDSLAADVQVLRHSASDSGYTVSQPVVGAGVRYYFNNEDVQPFASGHLDYHLRYKASGDGFSNTFGGGFMGIDLGGGARFALKDALFAEALGYLNLTGERDPNTIGIAGSLGMKF